MSSVAVAQQTIPCMNLVPQVKQNFEQQGFTYLDAQSYASDAFPLAVEVTHHGGNAYYLYLFSSNRESTFQLRVTREEQYDNPFSDTTSVRQRTLVKGQPGQGEALIGLNMQTEPDAQIHTIHAERTGAKMHDVTTCLVRGYRSKDNNAGHAADQPEDQYSTGTQ